MSARSNPPRFPRRETLAGLLGMDRRRRVGVPALAQLLGAPEVQVREVLHGEGIQLGLDSVEWGEAAGYLFDAWPRAQIIDALGPTLAHLIPAAFHPARVRWRIPLFILRAMEHQAALLRENDPRVNAAATAGYFVSPAVEDYIADILFTEIQPSTVADLASDAAFLEAYHYPPLDD
ncbi:MAG: hypothetical protein ACXW5U_26050 [Thermoanaerobaculia bacterium]